jgi:hypothetical protein
MLRFSFALMLIVTTALACKTTSTDSDLASTEVKNFDDTMQAGKGLETVFEDVRGTCVEWDSIGATGSGQEATWKMDLIENHYDLAASLNISSASQVKAAVPDTNLTVSQKTKFVIGNTYSINRFSVYLLVKFIVSNEASHLQNIRINPAMRQKFVADPEGSIDAFRAKCGDSFMSGYSTGGAFYGILEIETDSEEMRNSVKAEVETAISVPQVAEASSSRSLDASLSRVTKNKRVKIWTYQRGGAGGDEMKPARSVSEMLARVDQLAEVVKVGNNPRKISAIYSDYFTLDIDLPMSYRKKLFAAQDVMKKLGRMQSKLMDLQADIDFVNINPNSFENYTPKTRIRLQQNKDTIIKTMRRVYDVAENCERNYESCEIPKDLTLPDVTLPKRRPTLESVTRDKIVVTTKLQHVTVSGIRDGWFNPPECYVQVIVGANKKGSVVLRRSATVFGEPRCHDMDFQWEIPIELVKNSLSTLGAKLSEGWIEVKFYEDDVSYDDLIGSTFIWYSTLEKNGSSGQGINVTNLQMDVGFEMK